MLEAWETKAVRAGSPCEELTKQWEGRMWTMLTSVYSDENCTHGWCVGDPERGDSFFRKWAEGLNKGLNREGGFGAEMWERIGFHQMESHTEAHSGPREQCAQIHRDIKVCGVFSSLTSLNADWGAVGTDGELGWTVKCLEQGVWVLFYRFCSTSCI